MATDQGHESSVVIAVDISLVLIANRSFVRCFARVNRLIRNISGVGFGRLLTLLSDSLAHSVDFALGKEICGVVKGGTITG